MDTCEAQHAHLALSRGTRENGDIGAKTFTVIPDCAICLVRSFQFFL